MSLKSSPPTPAYKSQGFDYVRAVLGLTLLVAAVLKIAGWDLTPYSRIGILDSSHLHVWLILAEIFLGSLLLSGYFKELAWLSSLLLFSTFAIYSMYAGWVGQSSCGCFGEVKIHPWWMFGIDAAVVGLLFFNRPAFTLQSVQYRDIVIGMTSIGGVVLLVSLLSYFMFGSIAGGVAYLRGERVTLSPLSTDVGEGMAGEFKEIEITVSNWSDEKIRIIGGSSDCSIAATARLPLDVQAGGSLNVPVVVRFSKSPGYFARPGILVVNDGKQLEQVFFQFSGVSKAAE